MKALRSILTIVVAALCAVPQAYSRPKDKVLNRPYADNRAWHLGFSVGAHTQNLLLTHNGYVGDDGSQWMIDQPAYSPGFCVNGLVDFRLGTYFNLRLSPGMYFGNRELKMREVNTDQLERQNLKATFVVLPVDIKYSAMRYNNMRPYLVAGVMPAFDVTKRQGELIQTNPFDCYLTIGLGSDFYLPYFKFIPEIKFCFGLTDVLKRDRPDLADDPYKGQFTKSLSKATSKMIVLTFYFE